MVGAYEKVQLRCNWGERSQDSRGVPKGTSQGIEGEYGPIVNEMTFAVTQPNEGFPATFLQFYRPHIDPGGTGE